MIWNMNDTNCNTITNTKIVITMYDKYIIILSFGRYSCQIISV